MEKRFVSVYDLGTSSVKIAFISCDGEILCSTSESYPLYTEGIRVEQDAGDYWKAVCRGTKALLSASSLDPCGCIGAAFGTIWRSVIPIGSEGELLRRSLIWMDKRADREAKKLNEALGKELFSATDYWPKLAWLREHEPEIYEKSAYILEANAYLKWKATGKLASDLTNCFTDACCPRKRQLYGRILECAGVEREKFPPLCRSEDVVGTVTAEASRELGLPEGVPVLGGYSDIPALAMGTGCVNPGDAYLYFGTGGWLALTRPHDAGEAPTMKNLAMPSFTEELDVSMYGVCTSVGPTTGWLLDRFYSREKQELGKKIWELVERELSRVPAGARRLLAAPWIFGAHPPMASGKARGAFVNLGQEHTRAHLMAALMESFGYISRINAEQLQADTGNRLDAVTVCGGGTNSDFWMQALANILKRTVRVPENAEHVGALGVAYGTLAGLGVWKDREDIKERIRFRRVYEPDPATFSEYDLLYGQFARLCRALEEIYAALN